jgi:hypothetical protein
VRVRGILQICRERELINRVQTPPTLLPILKKKKYNNSKKKKKEKRKKKKEILLLIIITAHTTLSHGAQLFYFVAQQRLREQGIWEGSSDPHG